MPPRRAQTQHGQRPAEAGDGTHWQQAGARREASAPAWTADLGEPFDPGAASLTVHSAMVSWMTRNLTPPTLLQIEQGGVGWPLANRDEDDILRLLRDVTKAVTTEGPVGTMSVRDCWRKLVPIVHPDRHQQSGSRVCYAAVACYAMLTRCYKVASGGEAMTTHPMPSMLITHFTPERARASPPSRFEFHAAKYAAGRPSGRRFVDN